MEQTQPTQTKEIKQIKSELVKLDKYNIYLGLIKSEKLAKDKEYLYKEEVLNILGHYLKRLNIIGYNIQELKGYWEGKQEPCLLISFINTFGIKEEDLIKTIKDLREVFSQDCILLEKQKVEGGFI